MFLVWGFLIKGSFQGTKRAYCRDLGVRAWGSIVLGAWGSGLGVAGYYTRIQGTTVDDTNPALHIIRNIPYFPELRVRKVMQDLYHQEYGG